ncbi:hypothetical protein EUGRSUZ_H03307 [Eucalyptus grandis]|uniref:Uncharacterized protein n=3 Tax=Eucalyptus grandis TaxID=71139 RepID=A0ACC3JXQ3_EUCGR|nr:hypothetical protein EUGRSUZ_H03307 [Eucalyptus grandis]
MSAKKLLSTTHYRPIPNVVLNSLRRVRNCITQPNPPFLRKDPSVLSTDLVKTYFESGLVKEARVLFDEMPHRDVVAWTTMIAGYSSNNYYDESWAVFCEMVRGGKEPNEFTLSSVVKACKGMRSLSHGVSVHGWAIKLGLDASMYVENALLDLYATCCSSMDDACVVFRHIQAKNEVSWTTLITGFTHRGDGYSGLNVFRQMLLEGAELNPFSFSIAVRACASIGSQVFGLQLHASAVKHGFLFNLPVMNSILDMYCRCCCLSEASQCFHEMHEKDVITWNTLIAGYERPDSSEALIIYSKMESQGFQPNCFTFTSVTAACGNLALTKCGQQIHGVIIRRGLERSMGLANALIDMYAKCGSINDSHRIFISMSHRNLLSWTSMMIGFGAHGQGREAIKLFDDMVRSGIRPDQIVFMAVLSACSHAGLVDEGLRYFELMSEYNVTPSQEVYGCVVDLLGRAGRVEEAYQLIESMPFRPDESVWGALLGACRAHRLKKLGKLVAQRVLELRPRLVGTYVTLSNIYAAEGKWGEFARVRKLMRGMGSKKETGRSWIDVGNQIFSLVAGDKMVPRVHEILGLLIWDMKNAGYVPALDNTDRPSKRKKKRR